MILDPSTATGSDVYRFMIRVIVPRPIAFISTVGSDGRFNVAPFSFFCGLTGKPPLLGVSINYRAGSPKDTSPSPHPYATTLSMDVSATCTAPA